MSVTVTFSSLLAATQYSCGDHITPTPFLSFTTILPLGAVLTITGP